MAKTKSKNEGKSRDKPQRRSWGSGLLPFMLLSPFRYWYVTLGAILLAFLYWQWAALTSWAGGVIKDTLRQFGWGLVFIISAVAALVGGLWLQKLASMIRRWHYWLAGIAFTLAAWGVLAYFPGEGLLRGVSLGGSFSFGIVGYTDITGILRILGLVIIGTILVVPGVSFRLAAGLIRWIGKQSKKRPIPGLARQPKPSLPSVTVIPELRRIEPERKAAIPTGVSAPAVKELKQVAQEVWKKYGESPDLVTIDGWRLPPIDILDRSPEVQFSQADNMHRARLIEEALASYGVEAKVAQINEGPTVTQFGVEPGWDRKTKEVRERDKDGNVKVKLEEVSKTRVKVDRINSLANDLALALAASSIRIEAPVPGKSVVGIEVPNTVSSMVSLRGVIETSVFQKMQARSKLTLALGKGAGGEAVTADLARMPHLLVAGATGSGKTVCLNSIICCLLLYNTPNDVKFIMIDPKRVELTTFNSIPHLVVPVIVDTDKALGVLRWLSQEMNQRYQKLASASSRNIEGYNKTRQGDEKMPYMVLIIDELADLMMSGGDEVEQILCRLAQLSRAVGIHLVVATQRPSVDVVTGLIKANFPTRISFAVTSQVDSRTIIDGGGAEKLLGKGDMLYMPTEAGKPKRLQGCFVSDAEAERLVYLWGSQRREEAPSLKLEELAPTGTTARKGGYPADSLLETARQLAREHQHISASFLQRRLHIGYPRAARIMEQLEEESGEGEEEQL
ncbi:MAG: DNA translocase FtsK [Chloroflexi bacterium]|nr:DNA translocase FtsK [Chloroflexota bacterium]